MIESILNSPDLGILFPLSIGGFLGSFGLVIGLWLRRKTKRFLKTAIETTGTYVKAVRKSSPDASTTSYRVVEFTTDDGEVIHYRAMTGVPWASRAIGDSVPILYDPMRPEFARVNSSVELVLPWMIFVLVGGGILLALVAAALDILVFRG